MTRDPQRLPDLHAQITAVSATLPRNPDDEGMEPRASRSPT